MPDEAVSSCHHQGACDDDVEYWAIRVPRPERCTAEALAAELKEHGTWDAEELSDDAANWRRILWIGAGDIQDGKCQDAD